MHEPSSLQRLMREWIVVRYTAALERGDLDTLSAIMERAQHDDNLQLMLLDIHEATDEESLLLSMNDEDIDMETKTGTARSMPEHDPDQQPQHPRRRTLWINALAAAVLICLLGGGFLGIHYWSSAQNWSSAQMAHHGTTATPTATIVGHNGWCVVSSPALTPVDASPQLSAISGDAPNDIWAVGSNDQQHQSLIEHWNGQRWAVVPLPELDSTTSLLSDVQAITPDDVWAVGSTQSAQADNGNGTAWASSLRKTNGMSIEPYAALSGGNNNSDLLLEHWNGQQWSAVSLRHPSTWGISSLFSISAFSANDIWAAGYFEDRTGLASNASTPGTYKPLLVHWDGTQWSIISSPLFPYGDFFTLVKAISANDVWVASELTGDGSGDNTAPLLHWNGNQWQAIQAVPAGSFLNSFSAISANDIWAASSTGDVLHWNGSQWSKVTMPNASPRQTPDAQVGLKSIFAASDSDIWAVGGAYDMNGEVYYQVVEHWDGQQWHVLPSNRQEDPGQLFGVTIIAGKVWSVGIGYTGGYQEIPTTLIETSCH